MHTLYSPLSMQTIESWSGTAARTDFTCTTVSLLVSKPRRGRDAHSCTRKSNDGVALHQARHGDGEGVIVCVPVEVLQHLLPHILEVPAQEDEARVRYPAL